jgi:hypothetical protein
MVSDREDDSSPASGEHRGRSRAEERADQDNLSELVGAEAVDEDERAEDELLELDQTELDELGLTLDDPHQPGAE